MQLMLSHPIPPEEFKSFAII